MRNITFTDANQPEKGQTVVVGMSGGVDSTLTALLLQEKGCTVIGVTMSTWNGDIPLEHSPDKIKNSCYSPDEEFEIEKCKIFCKEHNIEYHVIDVKDAYKKEVLEYFKSEYRSGRTPNPCIRCNPSVKFGALLDKVEEMGIKYDYFCTGHYAKIERITENIFNLYNEDEDKAENIIQSMEKAGFKVTKNPLIIANAEDATKDQAYFLYRLSSERLEKIRFPLSQKKKTEVFELAREKKLAAAEQNESQDFVPQDVWEMLLADKPAKTGNIVDLQGNILGRHRGIEYYTIGQRRGLGVSSTQPLYVQSIDEKNNCIVLGDNDSLLCTGLIAEDWVWAGNYPPEKPFEGMVKIRLASKPVLAKIEPFYDEIFSQETGITKENFKYKKYKITFDTPQRAVAPGQSAVVYLQGKTVGGGIISCAIHE